MKFFLDTEFIEHFVLTESQRAVHTIDLISIGLVSEDGRELYLISSDFDPYDASPWVRDNVLQPIVDGYCFRDKKYEEYRSQHSMIETMQKIQNDHGKMRSEIAEQVKTFVKAGIIQENVHPSMANKMWYAPDTKPEEIDELKRTLANKIQSNNFTHYPAYPIEFYGYYADYDWVVFASLFGDMMHLPDGFPMYCRDLKQMLDEQLENLTYRGRTMYGMVKEDGSIMNLAERTEQIKKFPSFPKDSGHHNALEDALWNVSLYRFLKFLH